MSPRKAHPEFDSDSDQSLTTSRPSDNQLDKALRDVVADTFKSGKTDELTVKRMRLAAEKALGIEEGFFRSDNVWKVKSDQIIKEEVTALDRDSQEPEEPEGKQKARIKEESPATAPKPAKPKAQPKKNTPAPRKRQQMATPQPKDDGDDVSDYKEDQMEEVKKPARKRKATPQKTQPKPTPSKDIMEDNSDSEEEQDFQPPKDEEEKQDTSESEMSIVLDEEPEPSRKRQKSSEVSKRKKPTTTKKAAPKAAPKAKDVGQDPDQVEIKRLQGWLIKCGIRKFWSKELAPYDTSKAKIRHLKEMLADAGMKGRYSLEKAKQIHEERELKADLEMVQEGAKQWGTGSQEAEETSDSGPRRRRLNRGRQSLAFLEDEDGEETD